MPDLSATLPPVPTLLVTAAAFLLGSLVSGVLYSRARGADIRDRDLPGGSGTWRQFGRGAGILVSAGDIVKGVVAALLARALVPQGGEALAALVTGAVVAGHCYPVFFGFRGGGGIAPLLGALLIFAPGVLLALLLTAAVVIPTYKATLQARLKLNAVPFTTAVAVPVGLLAGALSGGFWPLLAGGTVMAVRAAHLLRLERA